MRFSPADVLGVGVVVDDARYNSIAFVRSLSWRS